MLSNDRKVRIARRVIYSTALFGTKAYAEGTIIGSNSYIDEVGDI